jgi:hypothetical protein
MWSNEQEYLLVHSMEFPLGQGKPKVTAVLIGLSSSEDVAKKDI